MNTSRSFVRCGVFCRYLFQTPWTISCASALELGLLSLVVVGEPGAGAVPVAAGVRCFGGIMLDDNLYTCWLEDECLVLRPIVATVQVLLELEMELREA